MIIWLIILIGLFALNVHYTPRLLRFFPLLMVLVVAVAAIDRFGLTRWSLAFVFGTAAAAAGFAIFILCRNGRALD